MACERIVRTRDDAAQNVFVGIALVIAKPLLHKLANVLNPYTCSAPRKHIESFIMNS